MIDIDKNLEIFYEREENKEDEYIGAISKHECVVDGWFVIELLEEVKRLRELLSIDEGSRDEGYCVTMRLEGCEYIGTLRLYKDEEGKVIE